MLESKKKVTGDSLLYAVGRQGNVDELNLPAAGLEADSRGRIAVNEFYQTKQPNIYAVGDVIGFPSLASVSMEQGRLAAAHAYNKNVTSNPGTSLSGSTPFPEFRLSARPKSSSPTKMCPTKSAWRIIVRSRAGRFAAIPPDG